MIDGDGREVGGGGEANLQCHNYDHKCIACTFVSHDYLFLSDWLVAL